MNRTVVAGILPAVAGGILPPGWKPGNTAAKMAAATEARRFMVPMRAKNGVETLRAGRNPRFPG